MGSKTALGVRDERITGAFFFDGEEGLVGLGGAGTVQTFACATLVIINGGENVVAGDIVEEDGSGFAAAREANIELGGGLCEGACIQVSASHIKMT